VARRWPVIIGAAFMLCPSLSAHADEKPVTRWAWTCGSKVFYGMNVFPNGNYEPIGEANPKTVKIELKGVGDKWDYADVCPKRHDYVEISGSGGLFDTGEANPCYQTITLRFAATTSISQAPELEEVRGSLSVGQTGRDLSLDIARDDAEWHFVLSRTDLTTSKRSRELRVMVPSQEFKPEASVDFLTGECILDKKPTSP
jgi:hypothetical protein